MGAGLAPVDLGPGRTARAISAGSGHTCALLDTYQVTCWGYGLYGQLGNGSMANVGDAPGEMGANLHVVDLGLGRTARSISAGGFHTCAVLDTNQVRCWGDAGYAQLGVGSPERRGDEAGEMGDFLPVVNLGSGRSARSVSAGGFHTCAVLDTNQVKCWGFGSDGQLGQGSIAWLGDDPGEMGDALVPVNMGSGRSVRAVSAGEFHSCAVLDNGQVKCWGYGVGGQLGSGSTDNLGDVLSELGDLLPPVDLGSGRTAVGVHAGRSQSCVLLDNGQVKCWGINADGQLGLGDMATRGNGPGEMGDALPAVALGAGRTALSVTGGEASFCAVLDDRSVKCWGRNVSGELGLGDTDDRGDNAGEMGDALPRVDLAGTVGRGTQRPDGLIAVSGKSLVGSGVYNTTGAGQSRSAKVKKGKTRVVTVRVQNDGNEPDRFAVKGTKSTKRFVIAYKIGSASITKRVAKGTYRTPVVQPGASADITVTVKPRKSTTKGKKVTAKVTVTSRTDTTKKDVVRATVTRR
jgi:alpha-tubulin suppressor-like RCC1 family protein